MKTIKLVMSFALIAAAFSLNAQSANVDVEKSQVKWFGEKIGGKHDGEIQLKSGQLEVTGNKIKGGNFVIDMNTITNSDLKDDGYKQKLVGHLKSDDFFGVEQYATSEFVITSGGKFVDGKAKVTGDLTIKGKTESISFDVVKKNGEYHASVEVDRSKFDVRYGSKTFFKKIGDKAIDDMFTLKVKLVI